jgi:hypothetical protein
MPAVGLKGPSAFIVMDHQACPFYPAVAIRSVFSDLPSICIAQQR